MPIAVTCRMRVEAGDRREIPGQADSLPGLSASLADEGPGRAAAARFAGLSPHQRPGGVEPDAWAGRGVHDRRHHRRDCRRHLCAQAHLGQSRANSRVSIYAGAGIAVGAFFTLMTLAALFFPLLFGLDSFLREMAFAGRIIYRTAHRLRAPIRSAEYRAYAPVQSMGVIIPPPVQVNHFESSDLLMVNVSDGAFMACQYVEFDGGVDDADEKLKKCWRSSTNPNWFICSADSTANLLAARPRTCKKVVEGHKQGSHVRPQAWGHRPPILAQYSLDNRDQLGVRVLIGARAPQSLRSPGGRVPQDVR